MYTVFIIKRILSKFYVLTNWNEVNNAHTAEEAYTEFITIVTIALDQACPLNKIRKKKKKTFCRQSGNCIKRKIPPDIYKI